MANDMFVIRIKGRNDTKKSISFLQLVKSNNSGVRDDTHGTLASRDLNDFPRIDGIT